MHGFDKNIVTILHQALLGKNGHHFTRWERDFIRRMWHDRDYLGGLTDKQKAKATEILRTWRTRKSNKRSVTRVN